MYSDGTYLYSIDGANGRIKKIQLSTGELIGWFGAQTSKSTGGSNANCAAANAMSVVEGWCKGAYPNPWAGAGEFTNNTRLDGIMYLPNSIVGDGTYLYITDIGLHRVLKIHATSGLVVGYIGRISTPPTGGTSPSCNGAASGSFTPGWCKGGTTQEGTGDGELRHPSGITYVPATGNIYVVDSSNHRVASYNATTGAFNGWVGRINASTSSGCTPASNGNYSVSATGWCKGGSAQKGLQYGDRGGGFHFWELDGWAVNGITTDGNFSARHTNQ